MNLSRIKKILFISLSNIGDIVLTFPALDILIEDFPRSLISVVVGPKGEDLLKGNRYLDQVHVFNKRQSTLQTMLWIRRLKQERFDLIVDLRNTAIPILAGARYRTPLFIKRAPGMHMLKQHLNRLRSVYRFNDKTPRRYALHLTQDHERDMRGLLKAEFGIDQNFVVISAGAADDNKRWHEQGFASVADEITGRYRTPVVFVGSSDEFTMTQNILGKMKSRAVNLCGRTTLPQLAAVINNCRMALVHDSAPLHIASYLNVPTLALFGPTDPLKYGPWGDKSCYVTGKGNCQACRKTHPNNRHTCMGEITAEDVLGAFEISESTVVFKPSCDQKVKT